MKKTPTGSRVKYTDKPQALGGSRLRKVPNKSHRDIFGNDAGHGHPRKVVDCVLLGIAEHSYRQPYKLSAPLKGMTDKSHTFITLILLGDLAILEV